MEKIKCNSIQDFNGSIRKYFNLIDMRLMLVEHYEDVEKWHKHETTSQIIFVIDGEIEVLSKNNTEIINKDEFIVIPAGEWHKVSPKTKTTKLLVIKYRESNINIINELKNDYIREDK